MHAAWPPARGAGAGSRPNDSTRSETTGGQRRRLPGRITSGVPDRLRLPACALPGTRHRATASPGRARVRPGPYQGLAAVRAHRPECAGQNRAPPLPDPARQPCPAAVAASVTSRRVPAGGSHLAARSPPRSHSCRYWRGNLLWSAYGLSPAAGAVQDPERRPGPWPERVTGPGACRAAAASAGRPAGGRRRTRQCR
jgi:hypothetical protein